MQLKLSGRP